MERQRQKERQSNNEGGGWKNRKRFKEWIERELQNEWGK